jgi:CRP-like cAMP-binding protein
MPPADKPLSSKRQSLAEMLRASLWIRGLTSRQLDRVHADVVELRFAAGGYVCRKGDPVDSWPGVISGLVKLAAVSADGKSVSFEGVTAGGWFGEGSLLKSEPRKYDAVALRETRIASMPRATFDWLRADSIPFNHFLLDQVNERLGYFIGMLENDRSRGPDARVAQCLAGLFNPQLSPGTERTKSAICYEWSTLASRCSIWRAYAASSTERLFVQESAGLEKEARWRSTSARWTRFRSC